MTRQNPNFLHPSLVSFWEKGEGGGKKKGKGLKGGLLFLFKSAKRGGGGGKGGKKKKSARFNLLPTEKEEGRENRQKFI